MRAPLLAALVLLPLLAPTSLAADAPEAEAPLGPCTGSADVACTEYRCRWYNTQGQCVNYVVYFCVLYAMNQCLRVT